MGNEGTQSKKKKKKLMEYQTKQQTTTMGQRIGLRNVIRSEESSVFVAVVCLGA